MPGSGLGPPLYGADEVLVVGGWGTSAARTRSRRLRAGRLPPRTKRPRTAAGPAAADNVVGTTAKDWAHGDVCVGEAETGRGVRELGPVMADAAVDKALSCPKLPGLLFFRYPPRLLPAHLLSQRDHCLWCAAGGQGRVRSAQGGHTVRGLSVGWWRRLGSSAGRQVRSGELRCRRAAASGGRPRVHPASTAVAGRSRGWSAFASDKAVGPAGGLSGGGDGSPRIGVVGGR